MHYKKILAGGVTAAAIIGAGGTALAVSGSDTTTGKQSDTSSSQGSSSSHAKGADKGKKSGKQKMLRRLEHGQFVTRKKDGTVTHDIIRGTVSAVSSTSITVKAMDNKSETFAVTKDSKVRVRDGGKGVASTLSKVAKGDRVVVVGTGTSTFTAKHVVDIKGTKKHK